MNDKPVPGRIRTAEEVYGTGFAEEEAFHEILNQSLAPRGFDFMFDLVSELDLAPDSVALDVGARAGWHCIELARRFGFTVHGIDPVRRHLDDAALALDTLTATEPSVRARIRMAEGVAEAIPEPDSSVNLIWCRDVLEHVQDLDAVFCEFNRVLRPDGTALVYQISATDWLTADEAARLWPPAGIYASSLDPEHFEAAIAASGLVVDQCFHLHSEWREHAEENKAGLTSTQLLWACRLLRNRAAYEARFGAAACEAMLTASLWGVYQMIGKLNPRLYVLTR